MLNHLTNDSLEMYLDNALSHDERAAVEAHLLVCLPCATEVHSMRALFSDLALLPPQRIPRDLTPDVLARVALTAHARRALLVEILLSVQLVLIALLALWFSPVLAGSPLLDLPFPHLTASWLNLPVLSFPPALPALDVLFNPGFAFNPGIASSSLALILAAALFLWLVANRLLLVTLPGSPSREVSQ